MPDHYAQLFAEYDAYVGQAAQRFGRKTPAQVDAEGKAYPGDPLYHPDRFMARVVDTGGMIPLMLYNSSRFNHQITPHDLPGRLAAWDAMQAEYRRIVAAPVDTGAFEAWKHHDPALAALPATQQHALFCLEQFQSRYFTPDVHASFVRMFDAFPPKAKILGDCDTLSYVGAGLLLGLRDSAGSPVFTRGQLALERTQGHVRLHIAHSGHEGLLYETTIDAQRTVGERSAAARDYCRDDVPPKQLVAPERAFANHFWAVDPVKAAPDTTLETLAVMRIMSQLAGNKGSAGRNFHSGLHNFGNAEFEAINARHVQAAAEFQQHLDRRDFDEASYSATFTSLATLRQELGAFMLHYANDANLLGRAKQEWKNLENNVGVLQRLNTGLFTQLEADFVQQHGGSAILQPPTATPAMPKGHSQPRR